jgi:hypothetical protein
LIEVNNNPPDEGTPPLPPTIDTDAATDTGGDSGDDDDANKSV